MNIYLLERIASTDYDRLAGMVVIAKSNQAARKLALTSESHQYHQADKDGEDWERMEPEYWDRDVDLWIDPQRSTCKLIGYENNEKARIVLEDYRAG